MMEFEDMVTHYQPATFEKWALRFLLGVLLGLVSWVGVRAINSQEDTTKSVNDLTEKMAVFSVQLTYLSGQVSSATALSQQVALMQQIQQDYGRRLQKLEEERDGDYNGKH